MAHLDAVLDDRGAARGEEHSLPPMATNTLLFTNLPAAFFDTPELLNSMLDPVSYTHLTLPTKA